MSLLGGGARYNKPHTLPADLLTTLPPFATAPFVHTLHPFNSHLFEMATKIAVLLAVVMAAALLNGASAQLMTGQKGVCCAFILDSANRPVLVCDQPSRVRVLC